MILLSLSLMYTGQEANNVMLTVQRLGLEGNIQVTWSTGFYLDGVVNGTFTPSTGTFFMGAGTKQKLLNFTVRKLTSNNVLCYYY